MNVRRPLRTERSDAVSSTSATAAERHARPLLCAIQLAPAPDRDCCPRLLRAGPVHAIGVDMGTPSAQPMALALGTIQANRSDKAASVILLITSALMVAPLETSGRSRVATVSAATVDM